MKGSNYVRRGDVTVTTYVKGNAVLTTKDAAERRWCRSRGYSYLPLDEIADHDRSRERRGLPRRHWSRAEDAMTRERNGIAA